ncbi:hypothetical protein IWX76_001028 [Pedobacter sp. CAN_A7]|uniref:hypothetical protein n=1 Tax=Pedobacter sp. CAN_A7 TaxID=2787722 RepID=UPI0018CB95E2
MESFELQLLEKRLTIEPQDNGTYRIMDGLDKLGVIYPEPSEEEVVWSTQDELDADFVQQVGKMITDHNNNS